MIEPADPIASANSPAESDIDARISASPSPLLLLLLQVITSGCIWQSRCLQGSRPIHSEMYHHCCQVHSKNGEKMNAAFIYDKM